VQSPQGKQANQKLHSPGKEMESKLLVEYLPSNLKTKTQTLA